MDKTINFSIINILLGLIIFFCGAKIVNAATNTINNEASIRMAYLEINPVQLEDFTVAVKEEMKASLEIEPGVLAIYAIADKTEPNKITFVEIYENERAYQLHRDTPHFQKYFNTTKDMIVNRVLMEGVPVELRDKYNTPLKK